MTYEYDYENIVLDEKEKHLFDLGIAKVDDINIKVRDIINKRCQDNWEPLYPFSVPMIWFKRPKAASKKKKA